MVRGDGERPGANDFRMKGGDRVYGPGTKLGNYVELEYEPGSVSSAERFSAARMVTDSRLQGADVGGSRAQFGLGIPPPRGASSGSWDWSKPMGPMKPYQDASRWQSLAQSEYPDPSAPRNTEFASTFKLTGGVSDREVLEEYVEKAPLSLLRLLLLLLLLPLPPASAAVATLLLPWPPLTPPRLQVPPPLDDRHQGRR